MRLLVTGGAGFIGSNFVRHVLEEHPGYQVVVLDKLTYAGRMENLQDVLDRITFIQGDIAVREDLARVKGCDTIVNFAAESHVDRSIADASDFIRTDVLGVFNLLEYARAQGVQRFLQVSTDEVYGSVPEGSSREGDPLDPSSPYSASKAAGDLLVGAYHRTYGVPTLVTRSSNNFGPYQYPEKLIPLLAVRAITDGELPIYGDGLNVRDWIYVLDNCAAIDTVLHKGTPGQVYNVGGGHEERNIDIARMVLAELGKSASYIRFVKDRPGHDRRYSLDSTRVMGLGWRPRWEFRAALKETVGWYCNNRWWWEPLVRA